MPMRYLRSYRFLFDNAYWALNLLAATLCQAIPVVGPMVFTGYALEMIEALERGGDRDCPLFDRDRVRSYLWRGLWPVIVQVIAVLPVLLIAWIVGMVLVAVIAGEPQRSTTGPRVALAVLLPLGLLAIGLISVLLTPLTLFVGLRQEVSGAMMTFAHDFLLRVGRETFLAQLFVTLTGTSLVLFGAILVCVPVFPALAIVHFAQYHLLAQLYRLYRERGGEPLAVRHAADATAAGQSAEEGERLAIQ
jgi:Protein of unknown function (DUF4013)